MFQNKKKKEKKKSNIPLVQVWGWFWNGGEISLINEPAITLTEWNRRQTSYHRDETYKWNIGNLR